MPKKNPNKRANARDVARSAGVSVTTVSRYLNAPDAVASDTREKISKAIEDLGFRRSPAGRAINSGSTRIIGALVPTIDNNIFSRVLRGLEQRLSAEGYSLIVATTDEDTEIEAQKAATLIDLGAEALVVSGLTHEPQFLEMVNRQRIPVVSTSYHQPDFILPTVGYDNAEAAQIIAHHLHEQGHQKIAVIHAPYEKNDRILNRVEGLKEMSGPLDFTFFQTEISVAGGCDALLRVLETARDTTACLCLSDILAMGVMFECQRQGISVPGDMSVSGMESMRATESLEPSLTTVHMSQSAMGKTAAEVVLQWIEENERPASVQMPVTLVPRASTAPPRRDR